MAGIKIDPEMLDIYMESLNKLMAGSETDGGNARLEVSGAGKTEVLFALAPDIIGESSSMDWYNIMRKSTSWEMI